MKSKKQSIKMYTSVILDSLRIPSRFTDIVCADLESESQNISMELDVKGYFLSKGSGTDNTQL